MMINYSPLPAFAGWSGPRKPRILLVGEAWGENEDRMRKPLVGWSGRELWLMLGEAMPQIAPEEHQRVADYFKYDLAWVAQRDRWLEEAGIAMTNVLTFRPPANDLQHVSVEKKELDKSYELPSIGKGRYLEPQFLAELMRLYTEIELAQPNVIVAMGATASWALLHATNIGSIRGTIVIGELGALREAVLRSAGAEVPDFPLKRIKILPTYHPAGVLRQWEWRPIVVADLMKALRESFSPTFTRPERTVLVDPTLAELQTWVRTTLAAPPARLGWDIETAFRTITCFGVARSRSEAIVVPFYDPRKPDGNYWSTHAEEREAWACMEALLESSIPGVGQNFLYDLQYIIPMGLRVTAQDDDTMLLHHSIYPEMKKGLGFLGSIYTNEPAWKLMRRKRPDTEKRDE